jgi:phosphoenolpyruvate phosphomutase
MAPHPHVNPDLVSLADPPGKSHLFRYVADEQHRVLKIGQHVPHADAHGEFIGLAMFSEQGIEALKQAYRMARDTYRSKGFHEAGSFQKASFTDMIQELIEAGHPVACVPIFKGWMEVDSFEEYQQAWAKIRS